MIPKKTPKAAIGGRVQDFESKSLRELMFVEGFDPDAAGSEWVLVVTDSHSDALIWDATMDFRLHPMLDQLQEECVPDYILHLGDLLGKYVSWGSAPNVTTGKNEISKSNVLLDRLERLAPVKLVLGNHDCHVRESPLGAFMLANCRWFTALHHAFDLGGVRHIMLSSTHDGALIQGEMDFLAAQLAAVTPTQEVAIWVHHPSGGRANDHHVLKGIVDTIPSGMTNKLWMFCGHDHDYGSRVFQLSNTTLAQWKIGAAASHKWVHFGPDYMPTVAALAFRDGRLHSTYTWFGYSQLWYSQPEISRASAIPVPTLLDGLAGQTVLSTWYQGQFVNAEHITNSTGINTYMDNDSWLVYIVDVRIHFPIPVGATKFFIICNASPGFVDMSADGSSWTAVTVPASNLNACILTIPVGLRGNPELYVRVRSVTAISAWGFAS